MPLTVATVESLISNVTSPDVPPPERPVPAITDVISPTVPSFIIVTWPFDAEVIEIPVPATRYEVSSVSRVSEPDRPELNFTDPVAVKSETEPEKCTFPVKVEPLSVATTESSMLIPYGLPAPPSAAIIPLVTNNDLFIECGIISKGNKVKTELTTC